MKLARIAIFLAGVIGMTTGGLVTISALKSNQEQDLIRTHENLKSQATVLVDQFFSILESAKKIESKDLCRPSSLCVSVRNGKIEIGCAGRI
jgi:hypothetical protein